MVALCILFSFPLILVKVHYQLQVSLGHVRASQLFLFLRTDVFVLYLSITVISALKRFNEKGQFSTNCSAYFFLNEISIFLLRNGFVPISL